MSSQVAPSINHKAERLIQEGRSDEAIKTVLEPQIMFHPDDIRLHNLLGIALTATGNTEQADREFHICIRLDKKFRPAYKNLAINELTLGKLDDAEKHFHSAEMLGPAEPEIRAFQGELAYQRKRFADAVSAFSAGTAYALLNEEFYLHLVESYLAINQAAEALNLLGKLNARSRSPEFQFRAGALLASKQHPSEALPYFAAALAAKPDWFEARYNTALCQIESGKTADAITTLESVALPPGPEAEADNLLAQAYASSGQNPKAIELLQKATALAPEQEDNFLDLANLLIDAAQPAIALTVVDSGLRQNRSSPRLHLEKGVILMQLGNAEAAQTEFEAAAAGPDSHSLATTAIGISLEEKDKNAALRFFEERASQHDKDFLFQFLYAKLLLSNGPDPQHRTYLEAKKALRVSVALNPSYSRSRVELGKLYLKEGLVIEAVHELETAKKLDDRNKAVYAQLAIAYRLAGQLDLARAASLKLRELNQAEHDPK